MSFLLNLNKNTPWLSNFGAIPCNCSKYSSVPNRRAGPNKRAGGKILEKY